MAKEKITLKVKCDKKRTVSRNASGDGVIKCDGESADILEDYLNKHPAITVKHLVSAMIKHVGLDANIEMEV